MRHRALEAQEELGREGFAEADPERKLRQARREVRDAVEDLAKEGRYEPGPGDAGRHELDERGGIAHSAGGTSTVGTPCSNGPSSSQNESTKFDGVRWQQTSPSAKGYSRHIHASRLIATRCSTSTPFGRPVDPEV